MGCCREDRHRKLELRGVGSSQALKFEKQGCWSGSEDKLRAAVKPLTGTIRLVIADDNSNNSRALTIMTTMMTIITRQ